MSPGDRLELAAVRVLEAGFSALSRRGAERAGRLLGAAAWRGGFRRDVVERQIRRAFPDQPERWAGRTARSCYRHFGRELAMLARLGKLDATRLAAEVAGAGEVREVVSSAVAEGPGCLVVTGHLGNWELAGALLGGLGFGVSGVVKRQRNRRFDRHLAGLRRGIGVEPLYMGRASRAIPGALEEGRVVALVADQDALNRGVFVPFLGRPASTHRGPARIALRQDVPLLFGLLVREGDGYRAVVRRVEHGDLGAGDAPESAVRELTRRWVGELESEVRLRPEQYLWFHRRWKTRPEGE